MSDQNDNVFVPEEVSKTAEMAVELHSRLFPQETPQDDPPAGDTPAGDPPASGDGIPADDPPVDEDFEHKYKVLQGKYTKEVPTLAARIRELEQNLEALKAAPVNTDPAPATPSAADEIIEKLKESYPEDLIENLLLLQKLQSEQVAEEKIKPLQQSAQTQEEILFQQKQEQHLALVAAKAPNWQSIWAVACEIDAGIAPSDEKIAEFLEKPDPSGLYTNKQLLDMYSEKWDADRFATVCNMYRPISHTQNPSRDALMAPSRSNSQPVPQSNDPKVWTMAEIEQFQRDRRLGKIDDVKADAIWLDIQTALAQNRIR